MICTAYSVEEYKDAAQDNHDWLGGVSELRNLEWVELPTSHWPMWSRPKDLAQIIGDLARRYVTAAVR
jgi:pimeloyl-ACP methyl ester carboxylesterase